MSIKPLARRIAFLIAGLSVGVAMSAHSELTTWLSSGPKPGCDDLLHAVSAAVNEKVKLVALTTPDPGKYFDAGSPDSCLGNMAIANLDLSKLIPDPMGLVSGGVDSVIDGLKKAAIGTGCAAVRNSMGDTISKYNNAMASVNGQLDVRGQIDTTIGDAARNTMNGYAMNWKTPQSPTVLAGVKLPGNAVVPQMQQAASVQAPSADSPQPQPQPAPTGLGAAIFGR